MSRRSGEDPPTLRNGPAAPLQSDWGELFDLDNDPFEHQNLYFEPKFDHVTQELKNKLTNEFPPKPIIDAKRIAKW